MSSLIASKSLLQNINKLHALPAVKSSIERNHYSSEGYQSYGSHSSGGFSKGGKHSIALSALTLLSFLFFLNILQNCLQEQMDNANGQVVIMSSRVRAREAEKRKGEEGILTNTSVANPESRHGGMESPAKKQKASTTSSPLPLKSEHTTHKNEKSHYEDKFYVKLASKRP